MIKITICDDENIVANRIENDIWEICKRENLTIDTDVFYSGRELADEVYNGAMYDIIYLDIQMKNGDGMSAAKRIREIDENVLLIYVSGYDKYMMELFRLDVFAFIKKPIDYKIFEKILLDANKRICNRKFYFSFRYRSEEYKVPCMDILYFESSGRMIKIYMRDGKVEKFNGKLSEVEEQLSGGKIDFLRIHQSYLVNYHQIHSRTRLEVTLTNGMKLPISEERKKIFDMKYGKLLGGEVDV